MRRTPLAIFTFNRAEHTRALLESVSRCARLDECCAYIYCDGPRNEGQKTAVEASRAVVREWASVHGATIVERDQNFGLARSIVTGVTELCEKYGRVIVVEDDFVLSPDFLEYMLQGLDRYESEERIYQISGYTFPLNHSGEPNTFFLPLTTTWGWATWKRAWKHFDWQAAGALQALEDRRVRRRFDADGCYSFSTMLKERLDGKNDSWGILWWWTVFQRQGLVLYPQSSLVWVGGFDRSGTHCGNDGFPQRPLHEYCQKNFTGPISFPDRVGFEPENYAKTVRIIRGYRKRDLRRMISRAMRIFFH